MEKTGKKLLITGKGRCNITNNGDLDEFMKNIPENFKQLFSLYDQVEKEKINDGEDNQLEELLKEYK